MSNSKSEVRKSLVEGELNKSYIVQDIVTGSDVEMKEFLFTLGCYEGQTITIVSKLNNNFVVVIKDARYSIDIELAKAISI